MSQTSVSGGRRHDLDALRVLMILALLLYHSAMPYVAEWHWHLKNAETSNMLMELNFFLSRFSMALLFVIAGVATQLAIRPRTTGQYLSDRALRLVVPLLFGMLIIVPPQLYYQRLAEGKYAGSILQFWPRIFALVPYPNGDTSWHHLWFIAYLFVFSALLAPALAFARTPRGSMLLNGARGWLARNGVHVLALPIVLAYALLVQRFTGLQDFVHDGAMFVVYLLYFVVGWVLGNDNAVWERIVAGRARAFRGAVVAMLLIDGVRWNGAEPPSGYGVAQLVWLTLLAVNAWCWTFTLLGYGKRWLNHEGALLRWTRDASYPFYILHQTVIVGISYYVIHVHEGVGEKFVFTSVVSLGITLAVYETLIRPVPAMRWLFGMPSVPRQTSTR